MKAVFSTLILSVAFSGMAYAALNCSQASPKSLSYLQGTPCADVVAACNNGGYYLGCEKINGKGLLAACFNPMVFKGAAVAGVTAPGDIASCKTFCQQNKGTCR
jgi:hypothetical protein